VTDPVKVPAQLPLKDGAAGDVLPRDTVEGVADDVLNDLSRGPSRTSCRTPLWQRSATRCAAS
jgi:hypothetical protein